MALAALVPLLGSLAGGTAASAGLLGAGMSGITGALTASALGSGLGTLAVTGDPMKALESGALGFLTGGALGGFGGGLGSAAVEAEKAAAQAAAGGAAAGVSGAAGADALGAGGTNALANSTQALKAAGIGGAEGAVAQNAAQQAALQGADALGSIGANLPASIGNAGMSGISANLPASIAGVGTSGAPALATSTGMGLGQGFKDTLGGIGGMKGLMKAGEVALPGISMSQPELAPYVAPVYTSPGLTPYKQRVAGGYTPGYRPGYDPEQLYFKPAAGFADGGEVPGYADGNVVRLADGTRNEPTPTVNNLGQQPNQLGRRYDQDRGYGFGLQNEQRSLDRNMDSDRGRFGQNMQSMQSNLQGGPSRKGQGGVPGMAAGIGMNAILHNQNGPGAKGGRHGMPMGMNVPGQGMSGFGGGPSFNNPMQMGYGMMHPNQQGGPGPKGSNQNMPQGQNTGSAGIQIARMPPGIMQAQAQYDANQNQGLMGAPGVQGLNQNPQQMSGMPQQDYAAQQAFSQQSAQNLMTQMQNGGQNTLNASMPQQATQSVASPYPGQTQNLGMMAGFNSQQPAQPQAGFADGGPVPTATTTTTVPNSVGRAPMTMNSLGRNPLAAGVNARPGLSLPGVDQSRVNPLRGQVGGYDRGPFAGGGSPFAHGAGIKGHGTGIPYGSNARPGLHMAFADGGGIPGMSAMGMMSGMPGGDMIVPPVAGDGSSDSIPATIDGKAPALLSADEHVIPADVVAHLGNGSSAVGHKKLRNMVKKVRVKKTGKQSLPKRINPERMMPA